MKAFSIFFLSIFNLVLFAQKDTTAYGKMLDEYYEYTVPFIQPEALYKKMVKGEKIYLLDTRESKEYEVSAIQGAMNTGFLFFSKKTIEEIDKETLIVVYCTIGARSETIGERLLKNDFTQVYNLYGGIIYWKNQGYPVYHDGAETENVHVYSKKWGQWLVKGKAKY